MNVIISIGITKNYFADSSSIVIQCLILRHLIFIWLIQLPAIATLLYSISVFIKLSFILSQKFFFSVFSFCFSISLQDLRLVVTMLRFVVEDYSPCK